MPALASAHRDGERRRAVRRRLPVRVDVDPRIRAPRTSDREATVFLAVEVDQDRPGQERPVERVRALEADLLGDRHQELERAVLELLVLGESHHGRDRDAVVGAERRAVGLQPLAVADERDPPFGGVVRARRVALADHVQVALEDERRRRLASGGRRYADHEVPPRVLQELEPVLVGPRPNVLDDRLLVTRRARDRRQGLEVRPEGARLEPCQRSCLNGHLVNLFPRLRRLRERLLLHRLELGLRDRAAVEELLRLLDLRGGPTARGRLADVVVELLTLRPRSDPAGARSSRRSA